MTGISFLFRFSLALIFFGCRSIDFSSSYYFSITPVTLDFHPLKEILPPKVSDNFPCHKTFRSENNPANK